jgi:hypothetical protein
MNSPIFIHSLFRSGSTYLFNAFRRSSAGYWCFQEALHENAYFCRENPELLRADHGEDKRRLLRHPAGIGEYFLELQEAWPAWKDTITDDAVYDGYFAPDGTDIGIAYWKSLINAAQGQPVFQECRTSGRIAAIKQQISGFHIYLWRDPWDQWWSYKVDPYFDLASLLIITAPAPPPAVGILLDALGIDCGRGTSLAKSMEICSDRPLSGESSFLVFYMLWCLGLREGVMHADLLLNIDRLTDSKSYRSRILDQLAQAKIPGLDFSDCRVSQGHYFDKDREFFKPLEDKVHQWLLEGGWSNDDLDRVRSLRAEYLPELRSVSTSYNTAALIEQLNRARDLLIRRQQYWSDRSETYRERFQNLDLQLRELEANLAEQSRTVSELMAQKAMAATEIEVLQTELSSSEAMVDQLHGSLSWRITRPLRKLFELCQNFRKRVFPSDDA